MKSNLNKKHAVSLLIIIIASIVSSSLPLPWNESLRDIYTDLLFKLRGSRSLSDDVVLVFIGDKDIATLGGWPISRDYYSYLIHILQSKHARVIGLDILISKPDPIHPEYDRIFGDFLNSAGNVCVPVAFAEINTTVKSNKSLLNTMEGKTITRSLPNLMDNSAAYGFSNFERSSVLRKVPLIITFCDELYYSFGLQLARLYLDIPEFTKEMPHDVFLTELKMGRYVIPLDNIGRVRLNYFGGLDQIKSISLIDLFHDFKESKNTINLEDKLVIVSVTASGVSNLMTTSLSASLPASLIHATIAENTLQQNFLTEMPLKWQWLIYLLFIIAAYLLYSVSSFQTRLVTAIGIVTIYFVACLLFFIYANHIFPLFYPTITFFILILLGEVERRRHTIVLDNSIKFLLNQQIKTKELELEETKKKLVKLENELINETRLSENSLLLAKERKRTILQLEKELSDLRTYTVPEVQSRELEYSNIVYAENSPMRSVLELISKIRTDDIPVLIMGETGTGKEIIAKAIHNSSNRRNAPFVALNCGALSETLLESELFGHEKGSFTGAQFRRQGRFELANKGTIFLDEITETTNSFQSRLLRVLQEKSFERIGGETSIPTNVRVIAATNKNISEEMENGRFRADLFYRLNGFPITLPSLQRRTEDIPLLAMHFLTKYKYTAVSGFSDGAIDILKSYHWPGNVRELENIVRRAAILAQGENRHIVQEIDLPPEIGRRDSNLVAQKVHVSFEEQVLQMLQQLQFTHSAISQTAKALGNKDRGTITEYFRGMCFEQFVHSNFDLNDTVKNIAGSSDHKVLQKVKSKVTDYIENLKSHLADDEVNTSEFPVKAYKGLPKKYHPYLEQVINHLRNTD